MENEVQGIVMPDYSIGFQCIAGKCRHSCCVGWEIDIDEDTYEMYKTVKGPLGEKLKACICTPSEAGEPVAHFIMGDDERCPFLNSDNLCELILGLGEDSLSEICTEHPRFYKDFSDHMEMGYGLCCEEAARLLLSHKEPIRLIGLSEKEDLRTKIFSYLQDKTKTLDARIESICELLSVSASGPILDPEPSDIANWGAFLGSLERLDPAWDIEIGKLKAASLTREDLAAFNEYMEKEDRLFEYENLLWYLIYRHLGESPFDDEAALCVKFAVLSMRLIHYLGACLFKENGAFTKEEQVELSRMFSSEIEYSDENIDLIYDHFFDLQDSN